jgi:hypothetical protein
VHPQIRPLVSVAHHQERKLAALCRVAVWACAVATVMILAGLVLVFMAGPLGLPCVALGGWLFRVILHRVVPSLNDS